MHTSIAWVILKGTWKKFVHIILCFISRCGFANLLIQHDSNLDTLLINKWNMWSKSIIIFRQLYAQNIANTLILNRQCVAEFWRDMSNKFTQRGILCMRKSQNKLPINKSMGFYAHVSLLSAIIHVLNLSYLSLGTKNRHFFLSLRLCICAPRIIIEREMNTWLYHLYIVEYMTSYHSFH